MHCNGSSKVLGISLRTVKGAIAELQVANYVTVEKRGRSNQYFLVWEQVQNLHLCERDLNEDHSRGKKQPGQGQKTTGYRCKKDTPNPFRDPSYKPFTS